MKEMHLFAGAGGGILGGMLLGHTPVCAVEIEPFCQAVLKQRQADGILPEFPIFSDIKEFDGTPWRGRVDVVAGGFPCQDISAAGKGAGIHGERSSLFFELARVVREVGPRYVFLENSPMLIHRGLDVVLGTLADMGYDAAWGVISAADCGANHLRKRVWILADAASRRVQGVRSSWVKESCPHDEALLFVCDGQECGCAQRQHQSRLDRVVDGLALRLDCNHLEFADWWETEPEIPRASPRLSTDMPRLKALGNGQVPRVAATAWVVLEKILRGEG